MSPVDIIAQAFRVQGKGFGLRAEDAVASLEAAGFVIVPLEPKPEMVAAWYRYKSGFHFPDEPAPTDTSDYGAYRAMLEAARPK